MKINGEEVDVVAEEQLAHLTTLRAQNDNASSMTAVNYAQADQVKAGAELLRARSSYWRPLSLCISWFTAVLLFTALVLVVVYV